MFHKAFPACVISILGFLAGHATAQSTSPVNDAVETAPTDSKKPDGTPSVIKAMNSKTTGVSVTRDNRMPVKPNLSPAFIDRCLEVADELDPAFAKQLRALCEEDPTEFERIIRRQGPRLTGLAELKASDPKLYQLKLVELRVDASVQRLAVELRVAERDTPDDTSRIESLAQQLQGQLQIRLGLELGNQMLYIDRMEQQLEELKMQVESQRENFDQVVQAELARLTGRLDPVQAATTPLAAPVSPAAP
ncbi:MAG: hypothetical protein P8K80_05985 [Phycisphaerales bacterium]|nr:hypothetical protein [Phycisphaerales bacterium]